MTKKSRKPKVPKTVQEAEKTVAANPRYEGLTIAEATRRMLRGGAKSPDPPEPRFRGFT